ncbi:MAG: MFS transporter, partial [Bacillota bacterium]|nr:MFS transporter [Bacillota bacterium]
MNKLSFRDKLGYSSAAIGDAVAYTFINTYLMFFLTTVAGIRPAMAGTLTIIGAVWNALINPVMGYISDHTKTSRGRRRPFMLGFCFPLAIAIVLLFTA